ncbi:MAG: hypothetical protein JST66_01725 [Bacteroidetes bacterium]|nr:hypothetical protein [Bacteroidota bacterium]
MLRASFALLVGLAHAAVPAQDLARFRTGTPEGYVEGRTTERAAASVDPAKTYHWIKGQDLHVTQGGYSGRLLHGQCTVFHPGGQLRAQGRYDKGVKDGAWYTWQANGTLVSVEQWRKGRLHGRSLFYDPSGVPTRAEVYRNGVLKRMQEVDASGKEKKVRKTKEKGERKGGRRPGVGKKGERGDKAPPPPHPEEGTPEQHVRTHAAPADTAGRTGAGAPEGERAKGAKAKREKKPAVKDRGTKEVKKDASKDGRGARPAQQERPAGKKKKAAEAKAKRPAKKKQHAPAEPPATAP